MRSLRALTCVYLLLACVASPAWSGAITFDPVHSGEVQFTYRTYLLPPGFPNPPPESYYRHDVPLDTLLQADYSSIGCFCREQILSNGYVIYDLSTLPFTVGAAVLELDLDLSYFYDPLAIQVHTVDDFTPEFLQNLPTGGIGTLPNSLGAALFGDLQTGNFLGAVDISSGSGIFTLELNADAIGLINGTSGLLALGLQHTPGEVVYDEIRFNHAPRLRLGEAGTSVPIPSPLWLLFAAVLACALRTAPRKS